MSSKHSELLIPAEVIPPAGVAHTFVSGLPLSALQSLLLCMQHHNPLKVFCVMSKCTCSFFFLFFERSNKNMYSLTCSTLGHWGSTFPLLYTRILVLGYSSRREITVPVAHDPFTSSGEAPVSQHCFAAVTLSTATCCHLQDVAVWASVGFNGLKMMNN